MGKHVQHVVNTVEVEPTRIIKTPQSVKSTVQRKKPITQGEVNRRSSRSRFPRFSTQ